jgi:hypothetical protein
VTDALYCETDSVIYVQPRDQPLLVETGDRQGLMTYKLAPNRQFAEFVSAGSKNYSFITID